MARRFLLLAVPLLLISLAFIAALPAADITQNKLDQNSAATSNLEALYEQQSEKVVKFFRNALRELEKRLTSSMNELAKLDITSEELKECLTRLAKVTKVIDEMVLNVTSLSQVQDFGESEDGELYGEFFEYLFTPESEFINETNSADAGALIYTVFKNNRVDQLQNDMRPMAMDCFKDFNEQLIKIQDTIKNEADHEFVENFLDLYEQAEIIEDPEEHIYAISDFIDYFLWRNEI